MPTSLFEKALGTIDGVNTVFSVSASYVPGSLQVWVNGQLKRQDLSDGWSETGTNTFSMNEAPLAGSIIQVYYRPV